MNCKTWLLFLCICCIRANAQNTIALPEIINYPKQKYGAGTQNWNICQDKLGIIYFANNEGLLTFDGNFWKKYSLPGSIGIRSLAIATNGRIYIGAQGQIGYFEPGKNGRLQYHSLNDLIPENERDFTDVWNVIPIENEVFFRSFKRILHLKNEKITVYTTISWSFLGVYNGKLIGKAYGKGLLAFENGQWVRFLQKDTLPEKAQITSFLPMSHDSTLIVTKKHGFYLLNNGSLTAVSTPDLQTIAALNPYSATPIDGNHFAIATNIGGCFIIDRSGRLIQRLSKQDGLQTNNVLSVFVDRSKNLWFGLENGIDFVAYNNAIQHIFPDYQEHIAGKAAIVFDNNLYIGTSNGLYKASISGQKNIGLVRSNFEFIPGTAGQVWGLSVVNDNLLMGHNEGFYVVKNKTVRLIDGSTGFWTFLPLSNISPSPTMIAGTYNGVNLYNYNEAGFTNPSVHTHFETARYIAMDQNVAWTCHPYKGMYKIALNGEGKLTNTRYDDKKGILSLNNNHLFKIKSRIVLTNEKGIFEYNPKTGDFEPSVYLRNLLPAATAEYLKEDANGNIWFVNNKRLGVVEFSNTKTQTFYFPELNDKITGNGFEYVYPYNNNNIFIAGEEGFFHLDYEEYKKFKKTIPILITDVKVINNKDSTIFGGYFLTEQEQRQLKNQDVPAISYAWNSLHFNFSSALYGKQSSIEYAYCLENFDKGWSGWSKKNEKDYTYLSPGTYNFKVKARSHDGVESPVATYQFTILPPWYRTVWAYLFYLFLIGSIFYSVYLWQKRKFIAQQKKHEEERKRLEYLNILQAEKHEEEQKQLMYLYQLELERNEKEIIRLRNEKLEAEIQLKNTELASTTLNLIQKGEMLVKVKEEFVRMKKANDVDTESEDYKKIIRMLGEDKMKKNWEQFAVHFDKVHSDFLVTLKSQYPNLTPSELKLCAYLRLNLSSKEIAQIMNISVKSVELARYRLRKKLQIQPEVNILNFLLNFHSEIQ